ncbi:hypothetical protein ASG76_15160 [Nocardioides sp. Soil774]|uniref:hypothetical protein n=1 Tax=Nocardioides sp. Soil774 TaxID=1736408 RepID=UPI0006FDB1F1|nr:hypothetical protein [Nocardioides sp. Soil774]KRE92804.1 hypothetical protein ASG76_15160 [Nocardioides sp. Soil774]
MTKGPRRIVLDQYLDSAAEGVIKNAGRDWKEKADDLQELGDALKQAAQQAELRIGEQTLTGPAMRASMEEMSTAMVTKSAQLRAAGEALRVVGVQIADTREARDSMKDLGEKPAPYQAPAGTPGVELNQDEIQAQADASAARQAERSSWQTAYDKQEARSLALTKDMDAAFLAAIPPMQEIHGQQDPTEPPPDVPSGPGGTYLPGTEAPAPTGGGGGGGDGSQGHLVLQHHGELVMEPTETTTPTTHPPKNPITVIETCEWPPPVTEPPTHVHTTHPETGSTTPSTTVSGTSQSGVTYQGPSAGTSMTSSSGGAPGTSAAALGAAGAAGGASGMAGSIRPGSMPAAGTGSARAIGSTSRAGAPGALSRTAGSSSSAARSAGSASSRGATGSSRGAAGARGAGGGSGSRGSSGARGAGGAGGRGGRKGEREQVSDRDRLVYDQDWLGDDDVAPGVLD